MSSGEKKSILRESMIRGAASLGQKQLTKDSYVQKCLQRQFASQLFLLAKQLHLSGIVDRRQLNQFAQLLRKGEQRLQVCQWLSQYYFFDTIVELDEALGSIDCLADENISNSDLDLFVEFLKQDGVLKREKRFSNRQETCSAVVRAFESIPPLEKQSSESARRLDSLLSIAEPQSFSFFPREQQEALTEQKSLWPIARSLQLDVDQACKRYFDAKSKDVTTHEHAQILHQIAAVFFDPETIQAALFDSKQPKFKETAQQAANILEKIELTDIGLAAQSGNLGEQERQKVELCLLLSHPIIQNAMQYVGPIKHLTDDVIARLKSAERKFAALYAKKNEKTQTPSFTSWLWQKANSFYSDKDSQNDLEKWNATKTLLFAAIVLASLPIATATAAKAVAPSSFLTGLQVPSSMSSQLATTALPISEQRVSSVQTSQEQSGFLMPTMVRPERAKEFYSDKVDVLPITKALTSIIPYGGSLQTRLVKRNICQLLGGSSALFGASAGLCSFGKDAVLYNLPALSNDVAVASLELQQWLNQFYQVESVVGASGEARVSIVTPNGAALGFMFQPQTHTAGAKIIGALTPFLTQDSRRTVQDLMIGGSAFLPDPLIKSYDFPPVSLDDLRFAKMQCSQLMKQYGEAVDLHQVLFVAPTLFETPEQFDKRLRSLDLFLQRCAADVANIEQFIKLCPPTADKSPPSIECQLQLEQLEARLLRDINRKEQNPKAWDEWVAYNDYVSGYRNNETKDTVGAVVALVRSHMSRHRIVERVSNFIQSQLDALKGNNLFDQIPADGDLKQRNETERTLLGAFEAASMVTALFDKLIDFVSRNANAANLLLGTPLLLILLFKLCVGKPSGKKLTKSIQQSATQQLQEDRVLAESILQSDLKGYEQLAQLLVDPIASKDDDSSISPSDTNILQENEQVEQLVARLAGELLQKEQESKTSKKLQQEWKRKYLRLSLAVDQAKKSSQVYMASPALRTRFLELLKAQQFSKAEQLVQRVANSNRWQRNQAKRLYSINPEAYEKANSIVYGKGKNAKQKVELSLNQMEQNMSGMIQEMLQRRPELVANNPEIAAGYLVAASDIPEK